MRKMSVVLTVTVLIGSAVTLSSPAHASTGGQAPSYGVLSRAVATQIPTGYAIVNTGPIPIGPGTIKRGIAECPTATPPTGGGVYFSSTSVHATVVDSLPGNEGYEADVSNPTSSASTFTVYAICAKKPTNYAEIESASNYPVAAHSQGNDLTLDCRHGHPLSGGSYFGTRSSAADINSSIPQTPGWRSDVNNGTGATESVFLSLVCGTMTGYHVVVSPNVPNPAGAQSGATASCGTGVPVGGGAYSSSTSTSVAINTSYPIPGGWQVYMNNASSASALLNAYVICAS